MPFDPKKILELINLKLPKGMPKLDLDNVPGLKNIPLGIRKMVILGGGFLIAIGLTYSFLFSPAWGLASRARQELADREDKVAKYREVAKDRGAGMAILRQVASEMTSMLNRMERSFIAEGDITSLQSFIEKTAVRSGIGSPNVKRDRIKKTAHYSSVNLHMTFRTDYNTLGKYLEKLENMTDRLVTIEKVSMRFTKQLKGKNILAVTVTVRAYIKTKAKPRKKARRGVNG